MATDNVTLINTREGINSTIDCADGHSMVVRTTRAVEPRSLALTSIPA
jgi:hypothetical protein